MTYPLQISVAPSLAGAVARVALTVDTLRALASPDERESKEGGGWWSPFVWAGDRRQATGCEAVSALVYDLDHGLPSKFSNGSGPGEAPQKFFEALKVFEFGFGFAETWTADRWRLIVPLSAPLEPSCHADAWSELACVLGIDADLATRDLARIYFPCGGPAGAVRRAFVHDAPWLAVEGAPTLPIPAVDAVGQKHLGGNVDAVGQKHLGENVSSSSGEKSISNGTEILKTFDLSEVRLAVSRLGSPSTRQMLSSALDAKLQLKRGSRDNTLHSLMSGLAFLRVGAEGGTLTLDEALAIVAPTLATMEGAEEQDWQAKATHSFERALERRQKGDEAKEAVASFFRPAVEGSDEWKAKLATQEVKGVLRPENHTANLELILANSEEFKGTVRFNELRRAIEVTGGPLEDTPSETLGTALSNHLFAPPWNARFSRDNCEAALLHRALQDRFDPVKQYLESLPTWDGVPRVHGLLTAHCKAIGNLPFIETITRKFFISAVARAMQPGCQVDTVLVLQGDQGVRKTSLVRALGAGFSVETKLSLDSKDAVMVATSNWLVELAELASLKRADMESVRAFITNREDQIRLPYAKSVTSYPRRCVFIGTTNSRSPLVDQEGNRRFWVVHVQAVDLEWVEANRDQLWAEALHDYREGETWWLEGADVHTAALEASVYEPEDLVEQSILRWWEQQKHKPKYITILDVGTKVLSLLTHQITPQMTNAYARSLRNAGFTRTRRRVNGRLSYVFLAPVVDSGENNVINDGERESA